MSGGGLVEVLAAHDGEDLGRDCIEGLGWDYARRCDCGWHGRSEQHAAHLADVVTAHLAARLEGCREEVVAAVVNEAEDYARYTENIADAALAVVRDALGLPPETQGAALRASDGADGPEGHREATRAGDGL